ATLYAAPTPASAMTSCFYPTSLPGQPGSDAVLLKGKVDFGTQGLTSSNDPVCGGTLTWDTANNTIKPELNGELTVKNHMGMIARVLVSYYDVHDTKIGASLTDGLHQAKTNLDEFPIKINGTPSPLVYRADVKTQIQQTDESWKDEASTSVYLGSANKSS